MFDCGRCATFFSKEPRMAIEAETKTNKSIPPLRKILFLLAEKVKRRPKVFSECKKSQSRHLTYNYTNLCYWSLADGANGFRQGGWLEPVIPDRDACCDAEVVCERA